MRHGTSQLQSIYALCLALTACTQPESVQFIGRASTPAEISSTNGAGYDILFAFAYGQPNARNPVGGVIVDGAGNVFGATLVGGTTGSGTVYELSAQGSAYQLRVINSFSCAEGCLPTGNPAEDDSGNIYVNAGSYYHGMTNAGFTVELSPTGSGYVESANFAYGSNRNPTSPLAGVLIERGRVFTAAAFGAQYGDGAIVELSTSRLVLKQVYNFAGPPQDGAMPMSDLTRDSSGAIYGTTAEGGSGQNAGTVFKLFPSAHGLTESIVWNFQASNANDGRYPEGGVALDKSGDIFGTTSLGGEYNDGMLFKLTPGSGGYSETILHSFRRGEDGAFPSGSVTLLGHRVYGTTPMGGGVCDCGTIFSASQTGSGYRIVHRFSGSDGMNPYDSLFASHKALYGTAFGGGSYGAGVVFRLTP